MIAQRLIEEARAVGLSIEVEGGDLIVEADCDPPAELLAELRQHKAELLAVLIPPVTDSASTLQPSDLDERAAIVEYGAGVPRRWAEGYAALASMPAPTGFSSERWAGIVDATGAFLDHWAAKAIACGWSDLDVFGCDAAAPDRRFDAMGLVLLLDRACIVSLDPAGADLIVQPGDARQRYRRRPLPPDTVSLWDLRAMIEI
jgi:hypothetical protein